MAKHSRKNNIKLEMQMKQQQEQPCSEFGSEQQGDQDQDSGCLRWCGFRCRSRRWYCCSSPCNSSSSSSRRNYCKAWRVYCLLLLFILPLAACNRLGPVHTRGSIPSRSSLQHVQQESEPNPVQIPHRTLQDQEDKSRVEFTPKPVNPKDCSDKSRRDLSGLGSSPPQCNSKCGYCTPCRAVHVPIQPGFVRTTEYYPEAWRCKCGNKLYMP